MQAEEEILRLNADLERRVTDRTRALERSLRDLEGFQAMLSHDLRAPLSVIQVSCAILRQGPLSESALQSVDRMERAGLQMTRLVEDLLSLARAAHGALEPARIDLSSVCDDVVSHLRTTSPERRVDVVIAPDLECTGDPGLVRTMLENLIGNAWKYSSRVDRARIEIGVMDHERERVFFVRDNGAGFEMSDAHRLFAPFERLHKPSDFEGTGVGLAAVHRIVERHAGKIWAEASPGEGATFYFKLA